MANRSRIQLKAWFDKGKYPTASQFADWIDSFFHKDEDKIPISQVDELVDRLNGKYEDSAGEVLERSINDLSKDFEQHKTDSENIQTAISKIRELIKTDSSLDDAKAAMLALGENYLSLYALASTVKTFIETIDTADTTINTWREIEAFLQGITDADSLTALLEALEQKIIAAYTQALSEKQNATDNNLKTNAKTIVGAINELAESGGAADVEALHSVTYAELVSLRNGKKLTPGHWYRITDYVTTVAHDDEARSAGHPFDILVLATDTGTLSEEARAIVNASNAAYFAAANLDAWKVWYCLDNDTSRFQWADETNGRGVIYRLIDEWQNDCPYDFKNIQFKRYLVIDKSPNGELQYLNGKYVGFNHEMRHLSINGGGFIWAYTFSRGDLSTTATTDASLYGFFTYENQDSNVKVGIHGNNVIAPTCCQLDYEDGDEYNMFCLNNIVFYATGSDTSNISRNQVDRDCYNMTLHGSGNHVMRGCYGLISSWNCYNNTFGNDCHSNTFGYYCYNNTFGNDCHNNTFGNYCFNNTFMSNVHDNIFREGITYGAIFNSVYYVDVFKESSVNRVQNFQILNGTRGGGMSDLLQISFETGRASCQVASLNSSGVLKIWRPADLA